MSVSQNYRIEGRNQIHSLHSLPLWAQQLVRSLEEEVRLERERRMRTEAAHHVICGRDWYVIPGPSEVDRKASSSLFYLSGEGATLAAKLFYQDVLLIGRSRGECDDEE